MAFNPPGGAGNLSTRLSKDERRKAKDLTAARQAGTAMPEVDEVTGKVINPHIPEWMAKPSWWQDTGGGPSLQHQKAPGKYDYDDSPAKLDRAVKRGKQGPAATKFRKGACENCGAMTHKRKDCLERPRKVLARYSGRDIAPDEVVVDQLKDTWDEKRDRWAGYDPANHKKVVMEYEALEEARKRLREEELDKTTDMRMVEKVAKAGKKKKEHDDDDFGSSDESDEDDETKYADGADVAGQKLDTKNRVTVRNLRIREDTAKYLRNLDTESAYYDPKTRSMREAPDPNVRPEDAIFAGENFTRMSGQAQNAQQLELFAWQAEQRGSDISMFTNPTQAALVHQEFLGKKQVMKETNSSSMLDKYGGEKYLQKPPKELLLGQSESYVEYDRSTGQLIKGQERQKALSKYAEDVYPGNHTSVWGSYWVDGTWGFACCHSIIKGSYCVGEIGKQKVADSSRMIGSTSTQEQEQANEASKRKADQDDEQPAKKYLKTGVKHHALYDQSAEEEMEKYRRDRSEYEDPLKNLKGDELLPM